MIVQVTAELQDVLSNSPHVELINKRVLDKIAEKYSITDEIKLIRTAPSVRFDEYNAYAEQCRAWGYEQKQALGVISVTQ